MAIERIVLGVDNIASPIKMDVNHKPSSNMALQFEEIFLQSMLKSTCLDQHFVEKFEPVDSGVASCAPKKISINSPVATNPSPVDTPPMMLSNTVTVDDFVKSIWPYAKRASYAIGLDPKLLLAQAALETGWGKFVAKDVDGSSSNNLFNIKAHNTAESVNIKTTEYVSNTPMSTMASFKKYASVDHSFNDYIALIKGHVRYKMALDHVKDPEGYVNALHDAGYATDPRYADKILSIYHGGELQAALKRLDQS